MGANAFHAIQVARPRNILGTQWNLVDRDAYAALLAYQVHAVWVCNVAAEPWAELTKLQQCNGTSCARWLQAAEHAWGLQRPRAAGSAWPLRDAGVATTAAWLLCALVVNGWSLTNGPWSLTVGR